MGTKHKILFVDDEFINRELFQINLSTNYEVLTAENATKGLKLLNENTDTAIVISDMKMPGMNGIEFIKEAKKSFPYIKYFIMTGYYDSENIMEALETGLILKKLNKPFDIDDIETTFKKYLGL